MRDMTEAERRAFLTHGTRTGKGADRADEFGRRHAAPAELLIHLTPTRVVARADIVD